ncbi:MAG: polysaccharide deacetylase family protein [Oscillospiraceae bacterium]|nr:polysaccharide deacetylase family protein [Oscillospiraceae bacterium]
MKKTLRFGTFFLAILLLLQSISPPPAQAVDLAPLQTLLTQAEARTGSDYTNTSWRTVLDAKTNAQNILDLSSNDPTEIDTAYTALQDALASLTTLASFGNPFSDIHPGTWFYDAVLYANANGLMQGSGGQFSPGGTLSRAMMVTVLYRIEGSPPVDSEQSFDDVPAYAWYSDAILWASENGIVLGDGNGRFAPHRNISRQEMTVMLRNYARFKGYDLYVPDLVPLTAFFDHAQIAPWAREAVRWSFYNQIIRGHAGHFTPLGTATRAECAVVLRNFIDRFEFDRHGPPPPIVTHHIDWRFSIYAAPAFEAARIATLDPQRVVILQDTGSGWAQIATPHGPLWAYLRANIRFIDFRFSVYAEPDFRAPRIATFDPQRVTILQDKGNGWVQISTYRGAYWVYLHANIRFIDFRFSIYAEPTFHSLRIATFDPQQVIILQDAGNGWVQIATYLGAHWLHLEQPVGLLPRQPGERRIALTFDDGPSIHTARLLDALAARNVPATFFVTGQQVTARPAIAARIVDEGHEIANHSFSHPNLAARNAATIRNELRRANEAIYQATGTTPTLLRPPYGSHNTTVRNVAAEFGFPLILWTVDTRDWANRNVNAIMSHFVDRNGIRIRDGDVILMHDVFPTTVDAAIRAVDLLLADGFVFVTVTDLLTEHHGTLVPGRVYQR